MPSDPSDELRDVLSHYDLGDLVDYERDQRGTVNVSYSIETRKNGRSQRYFLRRYKPDIKREEVLFEHSLINHLVNNSRCPVARLHRTRSGSTMHVRGGQADGSGACYYAVFDFIHGEDRYTWIGPHCTLRELQNAGALQAAYHSAASTLIPEGVRAEKKILELLGEIQAVWEGGPAKSKGTIFDRFLVENFDLVLTNITRIRAGLNAPGIGSLPEVVIHSDYHPGNLVFDGEEICGLVDFDWSKFDLRAFDVALALWYFCTSWEGDRDGEFRIGDARPFLVAYQQSLTPGSSIPPLSATELSFLPHLISAANIYVLFWSLRDYFGKDVDPDEYLVYLRHAVAYIRWHETPANRRALTAMLAGLPRA
jgi:homoserine kinase type II